MADGGYDPTTENETKPVDYDDDDDEDYKTPPTSPIPPLETNQLPQEQSKPRRQHNSAWVNLEKMYPQADKEALEVSYVKIRNTYRMVVKVAGRKQAYWLFEQGFKGRWKENPNLPMEIKTYLGKPIETQIEAFQTKLTSKLKQLQQIEQKDAETQILRRKLDSLINEIRNTEERMRELEKAKGSLDKKALQQIKNDKQKELAQLKKDIKQYNKIQKETDQIQHDNDEVNQHLKPLYELKQEVEELKRKIKEDSQLMDDENASSPERMIANVRLLENEAELERVNTEIAVRERPLLEKVKDIFKKYGWTLQAVVIAVGIVIGALVLALKRGTKAVGNGLNTIGQKMGPLLPGLIGEIVSYVFKAAGQVFSFLAENTWLLILTVVAFFIERLLKKSK